MNEHASERDASRPKGADSCQVARPDQLTEDPSDEPWQLELGKPVWIDDFDISSEVLARAAMVREVRRAGRAGRTTADVVGIGVRLDATFVNDDAACEQPAGIDDARAKLASKRTIEEVDVLYERATSGEPSSASAQTRLLQSAGHVFSRLPDDAASPAERPGDATQFIRRIEAVLQAIRARMVIVPERCWNTICPAWAFVSVAVTVAAVVLMLAGHVTSAGVMFTLRVIGSSVLPPPYAINQHWRRRLSWRICVLGHFTDGLGLLGISGYLAVHQRVVYATAASGAAMFMICATLFRVAALQGAHFVPRLTVERLVRNGSLLAGVWAAATFQADPPARGVPLAFLACVGPVLYAVAEVVRVNERIRTNLRRRGRLDDSLRELDRHLEVRRILREPVRRPKPAVGGTVHAITGSGRTSPRRRRHRPGHSEQAS